LGGAVIGGVAGTAIGAAAGHSSAAQSRRPDRATAGGLIGAATAPRALLCADSFRSRAPGLLLLIIEAAEFPSERDSGAFA